MGVVAKPKAARLRRHKHPGEAILEAAPAAEAAPAKMPDFGEKWHPQVVAFWNDFWQSPHARQLLQIDIQALHMLIVLMQQWWTKPTVELAREIRLQRQAFGVTPQDRQRLHWEVEAPNVSPPAPKPRRSKRPRIEDDPRSSLEM